MEHFKFIWGMHFLNLHVSSGVLQGPILDPLLFLIHIDTSQAVKCNLFLYADHTCLVCQHKYINEIKKQLNKDFDWFVDNKKYPF